MTPEIDNGTGVIMCSRVITATSLTIARKVLRSGLWLAGRYRRPFLRSLSFTSSRPSIPVQYARLSGRGTTRHPTEPSQVIPVISLPFDAKFEARCLGPNSTQGSSFYP